MYVPPRDFAYNFTSVCHVNELDLYGVTLNYDLPLATTMPHVSDLHTTASDILTHRRRAKLRVIDLAVSTCDHFDCIFNS